VHAELRSVAARDVDGAVAYYLREAGPDAAVAFADAFEAAVTHLCLYPLSGSLRFGFELDIPELRSWVLGRFPYLVFYVSLGERIDIWRVLHARRDIPAHLSDPPA
jgi:toxin ParE1/3/4